MLPTSRLSGNIKASGQMRATQSRRSAFDSSSDSILLETKPARTLGFEPVVDVSDAYEDPRTCRWTGSPSWFRQNVATIRPVSYTHLRAHETVLDLVCRLLLE